MSSIAALFFAALTAGAQVEAPYAFRTRLTAVHTPDRRDYSLKAQADEYEFKNGVQIVVPDGAAPLVRRAAEDFREYLLISMNVNASVREMSAPAREGLSTALTVRLSGGGKRCYSFNIGENGIELCASDERMAAQALYHLEDRMNYRKGPYLKKGSYTRTPMFNHRFTFSGFGNDLFPDEHLQNHL